ncbi:unnamed protein product [Caenorhabditis auriculariae]|uniref:Uncharacterized protein n=1 Tax=Caenorhabditis auriculariae TaxID=2777116 RepID=A0A8S1H9N0_9PELO|nr:unnamed protein product [Caenorhabditis auriculariae]
MAYNFNNVASNIQPSSAQSQSNQTVPISLSNVGSQLSTSGRTQQTQVNTVTGAPMSANYFDPKQSQASNLSSASASSIQSQSQQTASFAAAGLSARSQQAKNVARSTTKSYFDPINAKTNDVAAVSPTSNYGYENLQELLPPTSNIASVNPTQSPQSINNNVAASPSSAKNFDPNRAPVNKVPVAFGACKSPTTNYENLQDLLDQTEKLAVTSASRSQSPSSQPISNKPAVTPISAKNLDLYQTQFTKAPAPPTFSNPKSPTTTSENNQQTLSTISYFSLVNKDAVPQKNNNFQGFQAQNASMAPPNAAPSSEARSAFHLLLTLSPASPSQTSDYKKKDVSAANVPRDTAQNPYLTQYK